MGFASHKKRITNTKGITCLSASTEAVRRSMQSNRAKGTKPELRLREALDRSGIGAYEMNCRAIAGTPDIAFPDRKIAVFIHGCFWHRCPRCNLPVPRRNNAYWIDKFRRNVARDRMIAGTLRNEGWKVIIIWECEIQSSVGHVLTRIDRTMRSSPSSSAPRDA
jgi:DNA mismatch endonuclease (patch repair protein)